MIIFVSGGVRSGKSSFAESLVINKTCQGKRHYIATSTKTDHEMEERIHQHKENRGMEWITWEQPYSLDLVANVFTQEDLILIDCLTILTANEMFKGGTVQNVSRVHNKIINDIKLLEQKVKFLVIVSNDLFSGGVPTDSGTFLYMKLLGALHQDIAKLSSTVYQVSYGIPKLMKG